ncbi:hypothetical protein [Ohtaekwangia koreensis]|uniref:HEAT repeat domain-containing protein n=1 Tax=Ohtaekwangia koreensis TaxID=688867 RepID=A0A1T5M6Y0_9BACT|nr:hypothetical protein [Ohtaekwangia koreensis]SKC83588.1 hypothetical protein SAMN05660236_4492 [Ohtaekwangia koreensis]
MNSELSHLLIGRDIRTNQRNQEVIKRIKDQAAFNELFAFLFHHERALVMRAAEAIEKITRQHKEYIQSHKAHLLSLMQTSDHVELKWHIAQLLPRLELSNSELTVVWHKLYYWAMNPNEGKIVRINALQGLHQLSLLHPSLKGSLGEVLTQLGYEKTPWLRASIRKLQKRL